MKPKQKPLKSVLKRRKEKRLVTKPARQRLRRELSQLRALYDTKGARDELI